jgi:hypothetical protein
MMLPKRKLFAAVFGGCLVAAACTNSNPPPEAFVKVIMTASPVVGSTCEYAAGVNILQIGQPGGPGNLPMRIADGAPGVHVGCVVHPVGGGFQISLEASRAGTTPSSMIVTGMVTAANGGMNLEGDFVATGGYASMGCLFTFTSGSGYMPMPPIAAGKIAGHLSCPMEVRSDVTGETCDAEADVLFDNCGT